MSMKIIFHSVIIIFFGLKVSVSPDSSDRSLIKINSSTVNHTSETANFAFQTCFFFETPLKEFVQSVCAEKH